MFSGVSSLRENEDASARRVAANPALSKYLAERYGGGGDAATGERKKKKKKKDAVGSTGGLRGIQILDEDNAAPHPSPPRDAPLAAATALDDLPLAMSDNDDEGAQNVGEGLLLRELMVNFGVLY